MPLPALSDGGDTLFATVDIDLYPNFRFHYICQKGGIQMVSRLQDIEPGNPNFLLGPGPEEVSLGDLIEEQYALYCARKEEKGRDR